MFETFSIKMAQTLCKAVCLISLNKLYIYCLSCVRYFGVKIQFLNKHMQNKINKNINIFLFCAVGGGGGGRKEGGGRE